MRGTEVIVSAHPQGKFNEGTITTASFPGTIVEVVPGSLLIGGRQQYRASTVTTGTSRLINVLLADKLQGKLISDAYSINTHCFIYAPLPGEEINLYCAGEPGTGSADAFTVGELLGINSSGLGVPNSSYTSTPFVVQEHYALAANVPGWVWVMRT